MPVTVAAQRSPDNRQVIQKQLEDGTWLTFTETPNDDFDLLYEVTINGDYLGKLVLWYINPISNEIVWLSTPDDYFWSPPTTIQRDAISFLLPVKPSC